MAIDVVWANLHISLAFCLFDVAYADRFLIRPKA
jgi:hypothetical protein